MSNTIQQCTFDINVNIAEAAQTLAEALLAQANANERNSAAMRCLADKFNASKINAIEIKQDDMHVPEINE